LLLWPGLIWNDSWPWCSGFTAKLILASVDSEVALGRSFDESRSS
jgi:hypothetical protein